MCRDAHFRSKFQAAIVAIRRAGVKLDGKLGDVQLRAGDALLLDAGGAFDEASDVVQNNLSDIELEDSGEEREFMFAFQVVGACAEHAACLRVAFNVPSGSRQMPLQVLTA